MKEALNEKFYTRSVEITTQAVLANASQTCATADQILSIPCLNLIIQ